MLQIAESTVTVGDVEFKRIDYKGYSIRIYKHKTIENPRNNLNILGNMLLINRRYPKLGDRHFLSLHDLRALRKKVHILSVPVYIYEHEDSTLYVSPTSFRGRLGIPEDAKTSLAGYNVCSFDDIRKVFDVNVIDTPIKKMAHDRLELEIQDYNYYLNKMVFSYEIIAPDLAVIEQCVAYYGQFSNHFINKLKNIVDVDKSYTDNLDGKDKFIVTIEYTYNNTHATSYLNLTSSVIRTHKFDTKEKREGFIVGVMNGLNMKDAKVRGTRIDG